MGTIRGIFRFTAVSIVILLGTIIILLTARLPLRRRGLPYHMQVPSAMCRRFNQIFNVNVICAQPEKLAQQHGFIFPNHITFLDITTLLSLAPMRFLSMAEVRGWPFIGQMAQAVGTVFVDRSDKSSRSAARDALLDVPRYPPITLFPEGGILSPPTEISPFRFGAFEVAVETGTAFLPCVLLYDQVELVYWADASLLAAAWQFAKRPGTLTVRVQPLRVVQPQADDDPKQLALEAHGAMTAVLKYGGHESDVLQDGL